MWSKYKGRKVILSTDVLFFWNLIKKLQLFNPNQIIHNKWTGLTNCRELYSLEDSIIDIELTRNKISMKLKSMIEQLVNMYLKDITQANLVLKIRLRNLISNYAKTWNQVMQGQFLRVGF